MTPQSELEIKGNFLTHPFAELLAEVADKGLDGSFRVENKERKCVVYVKEGRLVFAASNARTARLYDMLMQRGQLTKADLEKIPNFVNDFELTTNLVQRSMLTQEERDALFAEQISGIITEVLSWTDGSWSFSPLKRAREGLIFDVNVSELLFAHGSSVEREKTLLRFRSLDEKFHRSPSNVWIPTLDFTLDFVFSRIGDEPMTVAEIIDQSAMTEADALHAIYPLWLGGLVVRDGLQGAFSTNVMASIKGTKFELKQVAKTVETQAETQTEDEKPEESVAPTDETMSVEQYLAQVENAKTFYDILGVDTKAELAAIKKAYFSLAKMFHPDRYHAEGGQTLKRIQHAFTELAQAHETLKSAESREVYDYRMRKELASRPQSEESDDGVAKKVQPEQAEQNFERGYSLLMDDEIEAAMPFLARAVHYEPRNAEYRAYYGKALYFYDENRRHQAESELQNAIKLDPSNSSYRIMLAEFFINFNLLKRAEGELTRLLAGDQNNREALEMLRKLKSEASG